jgi:hypothetical protein
MPNKRATICLLELLTGAAYEAAEPEILPLSIGVDRRA